MENIDVKKVQYKLLELIIEFDKFCKENKIEYYLMGGSALGAIRHKGFIPWDDDMDVFMTKENYDKFIKICKSKLDTDKFYFQEGGTKELPYYYSKYRMNNTTYIEKDFKDKKDMHQGLFIDIMCLYNVSRNTFIRFIQYLAASILKTKALADVNYSRNIWWKKVILKISKYAVNQKTKKFLMKIVNMYENKETGMVGHFFGRARFFNTSFPKEFLGKQRYVDFENIKLPVPEKVEEYLKLRYGNSYMQMPNKKIKDKYPSHAYIVDLDNDYKKYIK